MDGTGLFMLLEVLQPNDDLLLHLQLLADSGDYTLPCKSVRVCTQKYVEIKDC